MISMNVKSQTFLFVIEIGLVLFVIMMAGTAYIH